jgi:hypothetical protein
MKKVRSSNIEAIGWADGTLTVHFKNGTAYSYANVPADEHKKLMEAESVGKHFGEHIRGKFAFTKGDNWS